jgi:hypothetical protein
MKTKSDDRWKTTFEVRERYVADGDLGGRDVYDVFNIHNNELISTYRERSYAIKQARRKYKKLVKLMEKSFMSVT